MPLLSETLNKRSWFRFIVYHPYPILAIVLFVTLFFGWKLPNLRFETSVYDLTLEDLPETIRYQEFKKEFGSEEIILVVIGTQYVFEPATFQQIERLSDELSRLEGVKRVISLPVIKKDMDVTDKWSLSEFEKIIAPVDLLQSNLISEDKSRTVITLILEDIKTRSNVIDSVEKIIAKKKNDFSIYQIGMPVVFEALAEYTQKDFLGLPPITFLVIGIVLFCMFHNIRGVLLPISSVLLCLIWTFGLMAWMDIALSMLTMIVPIFLIAVGTAYCIYIVTEYLADNRSKSSSSAVLQCFSTITLPTSLAVFTTGAGLCSLLVNKIYAVKEFAFFSCFGMLSCLIIMFTFLPALMAILPLSEKGSEKSILKGTLLVRILSKIIQLNLDYQRFSLPVILVIVIFGVWGIYYIKIETNPVEYFKRDTPVSQRFHDIYKDMAGSFPINVILDSNQADYFEAPENIAKISRLQGFLDTLSGIDKTISFADYLKLVNYSCNQNQKRFYTLPEETFEVRMLINKYKSMLGEDMLRQFITKDFSKANIHLRTHLSNSSDILRAKEIILKYLQQNFSKDFDFDVTGIGIIISQSSNHITKEQIKSISLVLVFVLGIMFLIFLSGKVSLIAIVPNCFPIIINFGIMGWLGIELSMVTCLIASIAIGLAVDDTIHYLVTYSHEIKKDLNRNRALHATVRHVGKPIIFTTLAISLGFSILVFSHFRPTAIFGLMMVINMFAALIGDLLILPSLMLHVELVTVWDVLKQMKPLGGISADMVHELNQPLNAIKMGNEFLQMMLEQKEKIPEQQLSQVVKEIGKQVDRASETVHRLRHFDRNSVAIREKEDININYPINNVAAILGKQLTLRNIQLELDLNENLPHISAHTNHLEQMVYNLLVNSRDAILQKKKADESEHDHIIKVKTFKQRNRVGFEISDTGIGIPKSMRDRIFEPFFTCSEDGCGMGLGLSITYGLVKEYRGRIQVQSKEGVGSTFSVTFPYLSLHP